MPETNSITEHEALDAAARDAGYRDFAHLQSIDSRHAGIIRSYYRTDERGRAAIFRAAFRVLNGLAP